MAYEHKEIIVKEHIHGVALTAADRFKAAAGEAVKQKGSFAAALSGGSTSRSLHRLLSQEPFVSGIPWGMTHLFWVDERCVPVDDPASNYGTARKDLLDHAPIPPDHVHPMPADLEPAEGARRYQEELVSFFHLEKGTFPVFDLIFLGIGADGHTASLFPGHGSVDEKDRLVLSVKGGYPFVSRLTMTLPVLNRAERVIFLVSGGEKAGILKILFQEKGARVPARMIRPVKNKLTWLVDKQAAALL